MAFLQYDHGIFTIPVKNLTEQTKSLIIPLTADQIMIVKTNNQYQIHSIRNSQILFSGSIPKQFSASEYIKPISSYKQKLIYLLNSQADICKLYYRDNITQIRKNIVPQRNTANNKNKSGNFSVEYRVIDQNAEYIIGWVQNIQTMSCGLFVYDWVADTFSNCLELGQHFFNFYLSNLSSDLSFQQYNNPNYKCPQIRFVIVSQDEKRIYYNYICIQEKQSVQTQYSQKQSNLSMENQNDKQTKKRIQFVIKETGKKQIVSQYFPKIIYFIYPLIYIFANHRQGYYLLIVDMEKNQNIRLQIQIKGRERKPKEKGIIRKYLGIMQNHLLFTIYYTVSKNEQIYLISTQQLNELNSLTSKIYAHQLICQQQIQGNQQINQIQNNQKTIGSQISNNSITGIFRSIDGYSFHRYFLEYEKVAKLCLKDNQLFQSPLKIETFYRVPKKFFYSEMAQFFGFSTPLIQQIVSLL